jgi:rubrerythrin
MVVAYHLVMEEKKSVNNKEAHMVESETNVMTGILEFAMGIEKEGMDYYKHLANTSVGKDVASIFTFLSEEEKRHYEIFAALRNNADVPPLEDFAILSRAPQVFKGLADHFETYGVPATHYYNAYEKALRFEEKSVSYYSDALTKIMDAAKKDILAKIIDQEKTHVQFITGLLEFLRHPGEWLENAEWVHTDEF